MNKRMIRQSVFYLSTSTVDGLGLIIALEGRYKVQPFETFSELKQALKKNKSPKSIFIDVESYGEMTMSYISYLKSQYPEVSVITIVKAGFEKPFMKLVNTGVVKKVMQGPIIDSTRIRLMVDEKPIAF